MTHEEAKAHVVQYFDLQDRKAALDAEMKAIKANLEQFAKENASKFADGVYPFDCCGYLRMGWETKVKLNKRFSIARFASAFKGAVKTQFNISYLKALFKESENSKNKARKLGLTLYSDPKFEIVKTGHEQLSSN
ncbi:MAG: hypothetical protein ACK5DD_10310 [Cyclobacteriaceae bacterium]|jgi:hypothetical protein